MTEDDRYEVKPGDLVVLNAIGRVSSMVVWATWNDYDHTEIEQKFWPAIIGNLKRNDIALVLEIYKPILGPVGAKICTPNEVIGWINYKCLRKLIGDPAET